MAVQEPVEQPYRALHAANEQRTMEAASRNRKLAATALMPPPGVSQGPG
jgi:hypothetical protein